MSPSNLVRAILLATSRHGARLFRANTGLAWAGNQITTRTPKTITLEPGDILLKPGRPFKSGVEGMSDTTGWISVLVTPEMVGQRVAIYTAIEVKSGTGRPSREQLAFLNAVSLAGGISGIARSEADALEILQRAGGRSGS